MADRTTRIGMPLDKFIEQTSEQPFEIINREKRIKLPESFGDNTMIRLLFVMLEHHAQAKKLGAVYSKTPFILTETDDSDWVIGARIPDVMFYSLDRLVAYETESANHGARPLALVPDLVIEVISPDDKYSEFDEKIDAYLLDGVRLIWVLNPPSREATIHAPHLEQPLHLAPDAVLEAGDLMPGFKISLAKLFE